MARITASTAKNVYHLNDADLGQLRCELVRNPHYRSAAPMRLYELDEVTAASDAKKAAKAADAACREEEMKAKRRELVKAAAAAAASRVAAFVEQCPPEFGATALPVHLWCTILASFKDECGEVYDVCLAARHVCNAAATCRDLRIAAREALCSMLPPPDAKLSKAVSEPEKLTKPDLKEVCAGLDLTVSGNKPELIVRIIDALGLDRPSPCAPVSILAEARRQKRGSWRKATSWLLGGDNDVLSAILPATLSAWQARRRLVDKYGERPDTLERISRRACFGCGVRCANKYTYAWCSSLMCPSCCPKLQCPQHRVVTVTVVAKPTSACIVIGCANSRSKSCNASMCGLCCPRNGCARHP